MKRIKTFFILRWVLPDWKFNECAFLTWHHFVYRCRYGWHDGMNQIHQGVGLSTTFSTSGFVVHIGEPDDLIGGRHHKKFLGWAVVKRTWGWSWKWWQKFTHFFGDLNVASIIILFPQFCHWEVVNHAWKNQLKDDDSSYTVSHFHEWIFFICTLVFLLNKRWLYTYARDQNEFFLCYTCNQIWRD